MTINSEDEYIQSIINHRKDSYRNLNLYPEVHYNDFGSRGVIDLVTEDTSHLKIYEAKYNIRQNQKTIRQFHRHQKYFFEGQKKFKEYRYDVIRFYLVIYPSQENIAKIKESQDLYDSAEGEVILWDPEIPLFLPISSLTNPENRKMKSRLHSYRKHNEKGYRKLDSIYSQWGLV